MTRNAQHQGVNPGRDDQPHRWRIAVVVQRYGEEVNGGAELHARWLAEHLLALGEVHVFTTCALDYTTWENVYPPGDSQLAGVHIHRFPVDRPRNWARARRETGRLLTREHTVFDEIAWIRDQGPYSTALLQAIQYAYPHFDFFIFFTYLYATTFFGLPLVSDKAILVPTAHDDRFLSLPAFRPLFHLPRAIVYNTYSEKQLVNATTHNENVRQLIAGIGINVPETASAARFREKYGIPGDFLLYVGRIHESKNVPELLTYFQRFRQTHPEPLKLVLAGKSHLALPDDPNILHLGFIPEQDKFDGLQAAALLVIPSLFESLSMVALEAWLMEKPVLVNGRCDVLKHQCRRSNGGLYYTSYDEFAATLSILLADAGLQQRMGQQGAQFVKARYHWNVIMAKYKALLQELMAEKKSTRERHKPRDGAGGS